MEEPNLDEILSKAYDDFEAGASAETTTADVAPADPPSDPPADPPEGDPEGDPPPEGETADPPKEESDALRQEEERQEAEIPLKYQELDRLLEPRKQAWAMAGMTEQQAIHQLLALSDFAEQQPEQFIRWFAEQRGVDLSATPETPDDPVQAKIAELESYIRNKENEQTNAQQQAIQGEIESFRTAKVDGKLAHPHFETVKRAMGALMQAGHASNMEEAYQRAIWADPEIRAKLIAEQEKAKEAERVQATKAAAAKAARATAGSPESQSVTTSEASESLDETLARAYDSAVSA